jgi:hypothetical protein
MPVFPITKDLASAARETLPFSDNNGRIHKIRNYCFVPVTSLALIFADEPRRRVFHRMSLLPLQRQNDKQQQMQTAHLFNQKMTTEPYIDYGPQNGGSAQIRQKIFGFQLNIDAFQSPRIRQHSR